ncbi:hypothetical protein LBMAG42_28700 [Deltaproteobacteria bacterium]|nr:hypothetical protein LBMAG42_28700 [Deltaproteobacteria bacterium]
MRTLIILSLLLVVGCAKEKSVAKPTGGVVAKDGGITAETEVPEDADSRKFADHLVRNPLRDFSPSDSTGGAGIKWDSVTFGPKNHWEADAVLTAGGETVRCTEQGRWTIEKAESATKDTVNLETKKSTCPGRSDATSYRLVMDIAGDNYQVVFR